MKKIPKSLILAISLEKKCECYEGVWRVTDLTPIFQSSLFVLIRNRTLKNIAEILNLVDILLHFFIAFDVVDRTCFLNLFFSLGFEDTTLFVFPWPFLVSYGSKSFIDLFPYLFLKDRVFLHLLPFLLSMRINS